MKLDDGGVSNAREESDCRADVDVDGGCDCGVVGRVCIRGSKGVVRCGGGAGDARAHMLTNEKIAPRGTFLEEMDALGTYCEQFYCSEDASYVSKT